MSNHHQSLQSEKYLLATLRDDKQLARQQARASIQNTFWNVCLVAISAAAGFYAVKTMPIWMPFVESSFHQLTNYRYF